MNTQKKPAEEAATDEEARGVSKTSSEPENADPMHLLEKLESLQKQIDAVRDEARHPSHARSGRSVRFTAEDSDGADNESDKNKPRTRTLSVPKVPSKPSSRRSSQGKLSMQSDFDPTSSMGTSIYDPWEGNCPNYNTLDVLGDPANLERMRMQRKTLFRQVTIANQVSLPFRILGVCLAFLTVIFIWETTNRTVARFFPTIEIRLISYMALALMAAVCLAFSHHWVLGAESSLMPSFAYSLSTLFLAIGSWGLVQTTVDILVPKKLKLFSYATLALITLICTIAYAIQTKHNVLLDIASCAATLGLHDEEDIES